MRIVGSGASEHPSGDPHKSRAAAAVAAATRADAATTQRAEELARLAEPEHVHRPGEPGSSTKADTVGGRVLRVDSDNWIDVAPQRMARWLENFGERHPGDVRLRAVPHGLQAQAADGTIADCFVPFPRSWSPPDDPAEAAAAATAHALAPRTVGVLLVRLGGYAVGVFEGVELVASKVGGRPVASRQSNGGWSQSRYANRRVNQAEAHLGAAADTAVRILLGAKLDALVIGGESRALSKVLGDPRLAPLVELGPEDRMLTVPDPRLDVLKATPEMFTAIKVRLLR